MFPQKVLASLGGGGGESLYPDTFLAKSVFPDHGAPFAFVRRDNIHCLNVGLPLFAPYFSLAGP